ncbi:MAG TPA: uracil-DNA glycosylase, partial [Verrucomicrobiae bacterium]|nr:uracil-DNA glycosylase [Verrucomicrobiae bacterium]
MSDGKVLRMSAYEQLLEATIQHLEELKQQGARFVMVAPDRLAALAKPVSRHHAPQAHVVSPATTQKSEIKNQKSEISQSAAEQPALMSLSGDPAPTAPLPELSPESRTAAFAELR